MRQEQYQAGEQVPLRLASDYELIDDGLRHVGEIAELRFPQHQRFRIIAAVAVFKAEDSGFGQRGVINLAVCLVFRNVFQWHVFLFVLDIKKNRMPLVEGAAAAILSAESYRSSGLDQACERQRFRHAVIHRAFTRAHFRALLQQLLDLGMNVKALRKRGQPICQFA